MPRRLRVAFDPSQNITLGCAAGIFTRTGKAATLNYVPNTVIADVWTKLSTVLTVGDTRSGPNFNQGWARVAMNTNTGMPWAFQHNPSDGAYGGNWYFDAAVGYWQRTNTVFDDWHRDPLSLWENYDLSYDYDTNTFYRSHGGPVGGSSGPFNGDCVYSIDTDEWRNVYPDSTATYVPTAADAGYYGTTGNTMGRLSNAEKYYDGYIYHFGGLSVGASQNMKKREIATGTITTLLSYTALPPWSGNYRSGIYRRAGLDSRTKQLYVLANDAQYWSCDLTQSTLVWEYKTATGWVGNDPPPSYPTYTGGDFGVVGIIDEAANCFVGWTGTNGLVAADSGSAIRKTYIMDLATRVWRDGPSFAAGHTVPPACYATQADMMYDPVGKRTILTVGRGVSGTEVWALQIAPIGGIITSWPLPSSSGSTYGTNYYGFPYTANGASKHTNMCYCPADGRLYVSGGDTATSATNGTWSMSLDDGSWRLDVGEPSYPTLAAPYALQDGAGFEWCEARQRMIMWPGAYYPYPPPIDTATYPDHNYSLGFWYYDPINAEWTQELGLFSTAYSGTGCLYGGVYDNVNDHFVTFGDSSTGFSCRRWSLTTLAQLSNVAYTVSRPAGYAAYFTRGKPVKIGRKVYIIGYRTNGTTASQEPILLCWDLDALTMTQLTAPPCSGPAMVEIEIRPAASGAKLVFPFVASPTGALLGLYVYNPANDTWTEDTKRPVYGNFIMNAVCSLPDGRVAMSGGVFGSQQTHMWFYKAA